jgi:hypothetical protein
LDAVEQRLVQALTGTTSSVEPGPRQVERELALAALYRRHGCRPELDAALARLDGALLQMEPETWARWAELAFASGPERVLRSLGRRAAEAPYPTQTALALGRVLGAVDCRRPFEVELVGSACRALLGRDPAVSALFPSGAAPRRPTPAELAALVENRESLTLLGSVAIAAARCEGNQELARASLATLRLARPRLLPKFLIPLLGLKASARVIADLLGPDPEKVATDIAIAEYLLDPPQCDRKVSDWRRLGFSPVAFAAYLATLGGNDSALRDCLEHVVFSAPKDSASAQRLLVDLPPIARVAPATGARLADLGWGALRRIRTDKVTIDVALADLVATELLLVERGMKRPAPCELLTTPLEAPEATLAEWRRLAAAEAIRDCPETARALLTQSGSAGPGLFELVRRLGRRDRAHAARLALARLGGAPPAEQGELAAGLLYALSSDPSATATSVPRPATSGVAPAGSSDSN